MLHHMNLVGVILVGTSLVGVLGFQPLNAQITQSSSSSSSSIGSQYRVSSSSSSSSSLSSLLSLYNPSPRSQCSATALFSSSNGDFDDFASNEGNRQNDAESSSSSDFMKSLQNRMNQVADRENKLPIVVLDSMLPRQTLQLETNDPTFMAMIRNLLENESPRFGMVGMAKLVQTGEQSPLQNGVEIVIEGQPKVVPISSSKVSDEQNAASDFQAENQMIRVDLRAARRIRIMEEQIDNAPQGWGEARVQYLESEDEELEEEVDSNDDPMSLFRAMQQAREFTEKAWTQDRPDQTLVDRWIELARENERSAGQIDKLLDTLGEIPPATSPSERAFWIGALINPLPGMGVAMEVRPQLLMAKKAEVRVDVALRGMLDSIAHMDGTKRLF